MANEKELMYQILRMGSPAYQQEQRLKRQIRDLLLERGIDHSLDEIVDAGSDSMVVWIEGGRLVRKYYVGGQALCLGERLGETLLEYQQCHQNASELALSGRYDLNVGEIRLPVRVNPIDTVYWHNRGECWAAESTAWNGDKLFEMRLGNPEINYEICQGLSRVYTRIGEDLGKPEAFIYHSSNSMLMENYSEGTEPAATIVITDLCEALSHLARYLKN